MVSATTERFDRIVQQFTAAFDQVTIAQRDERPARALLELTGVYGSYRVRLLEIITPDGRRKYSFYVLRGDEVIVGFDNAADPFALKLKYGAEYKAHILERIPHCHTEGKTKLALTEEMDCAQFISWVQTNLPSA